MSSRVPPVILCFSGHDPTGGAGVQADIEALTEIGCHACSVLTALTVQDTRDVQRVLPQDPANFLLQARLLLHDVSVQAVKIGLLGSAAIARSVVTMLGELPSVPVVLDPILAAGGGTSLARDDLLQILREELLPRATVVTPNTPEARALAATGEDVDAWSGELLRRGCGHVLVTGTHDSGRDVVNRLYGPDGGRSWHWERLSATYHGSGCTLAASLAGYLAQNLPVEEAAFRAQEFTWQALRSGFSVGRGQYLPNRRRLPP